MKKVIVNILFVALWTVMALVLALAAVLICSVRLLKPEHLTPVVERIANKSLDADVTIGRIELAFKPAFPVINLQVDSLTVISHAFADLDSAQRAALPA